MHHLRRCFPERHVHRYSEDIAGQLTHEYTANDGLGLFGLNLQANHYILLEIRGFTREVLPGPNLLRWYREGMGNDCKEYMNYPSAFITEALKSKEMRVSIFDRKTGDGVNIGSWILFGYSEWREVIHKWALRGPIPTVLLSELLSILDISSLGYGKKIEAMFFIGVSANMDSNLFSFEEMAVFQDNRRNTPSPSSPPPRPWRPRRPRRPPQTERTPGIIPIP